MKHIKSMSKPEKAVETRWEPGKVLDAIACAVNPEKEKCATT